MSESNGYATIESIAANADKRRFADDVEIPGLGKVSLGSMTGLVFLQYQAARERATTHALSGERSKQTQALQDIYLILATNCILTRDHNPLFSEQHRPMLLGLDGAIIGSIIEACVNHALGEEADIGAAQKN